VTTRSATLSTTQSVNSSPDSGLRIIRSNDGNNGGQYADHI
jgi:hypothetical protein